MDWNKIREYILGFLRWTALAVAIGLVVGLAGTLFGFGLHEVTALREKWPWLLYLLPLGGVTIVGLYRGSKYPDGGSTNSVFLAVRENKPMPLRTAPLIFVSTLLLSLIHISEPTRLLSISYAVFCLKKKKKKKTIR